MRNKTIEQFTRKAHFFEDWILCNVIKTHNFFKGTFLMKFFNEVF